MTRGKLVLAGATGFMGRPLVDSLVRDGFEVVVLSRHPGAAVLPAGARAVAWDGTSVDGWSGELADATGIVNLAGASIGRWRWTPARKREIVRSRVETTRALVEACGRLRPEQRPQVLVNSSGIDYAGDSGDEIVTEQVRPGDSFLARVCVEWEAAALGAEALGVRAVVMRTPLVVGRGALALRLMALPFRLFTGGPLGDGRQWFPWAHLEDTVAAYRRALEDERLRGAVNLVAPALVRQRDAARELGAVLSRPSWLPAPRPALRALLGEQADLLLHGQRAVPTKLVEVGFRFAHPSLRGALEDALR
jgi:uncharacterized protein (TIGR01777 family)